jgi:hypothetical protein
MNGYGSIFVFFVFLFAFSLWLRRKQMRKLHPERFIPLTWKQRLVLYFFPTIVWFSINFYSFYGPDYFRCGAFQPGSASGLMLFLLPYFYLLHVGPFVLVLPYLVKGDRKIIRKKIAKFGIVMYSLTMLAGAMLAAYFCNSDFFAI